LFKEEEIWRIVNETTPTISNIKRVERTLLAYNNFLGQIHERVHIIISLESGLSNLELSNLFISHSFLFTEFYIDIYKKFTPEILNSISNYFVILQIEEHKLKKLNLTKKYTSIDDDDDVSLTPKEIQVYSSTIVEMHLTAFHLYSNMYSKFKNEKHVLMPKPFSVTMFKQIAFFFHLYMKRIRAQELAKIEKLQKVLQKIDQVNHRLENYDHYIEETRKKLRNLNSVLDEWDEKVNKQKENYRKFVTDCKSEEKLIDEMNMALEQLKKEVNNESHELKSLYTPQFDIAVEALKLLSMQSFSELRSFRQPPQRVLAVVNTLCLMFRQPPGWENGKQLLIRENFFDDLLFYDKKNIPNDIYEALDQICSVETFNPQYVRMGSTAAASLCEWILSVHRFAKYERKIYGRANELKDYEDLYKKRISSLGEKRMKSEEACKILEDYCRSRLEVLKEIKKVTMELEDMDKNRENVQRLYKLLLNDKNSWTEQLDKSTTLIRTYKPDSLLTAFFVCYAGIFDCSYREILVQKWIKSMDKLRIQNTTSSGIKFDETTSSLTRNSQGKYSLRPFFNIKDVLLNPTCETKELMLNLRRLSLNDDYYLENALILRELSSSPTKFNSWLLIHDPENITLELISVLHESIDQLKICFNSKYSNLMTPQSSTNNILNNSLPAYNHVFSKDNNNRKQNVHPSSSVSSLNEFFSTNSPRDSSLNCEDLINQDDETDSQRVQSLPPISIIDTSRLSRKSNYYSRTASSIWEASTFYSRAQTTATSVYHTRSGNKTFLNIDFENEIRLPIIETDVNIMPKNNMCILDARDEDLDYKLINAAVHGLTVLVKNSERFTYQTNKLIDLILDRDFLVDSDDQNKEYLKIGDEKIQIDAGFRVIFHVSKPSILSFMGKNNQLFSRLVTPLNAAHFVLDFTPSMNYIQNDCLQTIMEREKPGYKNQLQLSLKISTEAEYNIQNRQV
jgi:hypothetical protein